MEKNKEKYRDQQRSTKTKKIGGNKIRGRQNKLPREKKLQKGWKNREDRKKTGNTRENGKKKGEKCKVKQLEANS